MGTQEHPLRVLRWESLTKRAFDELPRSRCVVLATCSPLEVHGPHLPLGADALEGEGLAERVLRFLPERHRQRIFLKLPLVYAAADVVPQPGSLAFRPSTVSRFLEDLGGTLAAQGFRDVLISNFHGGPRHFVAIERACQRVSKRRGIRMVSLFSLMLSRLTGGSENLEQLIGALPGVKPEDLRDDTHAGFLETSQLLALHGGWVDPIYKELPRISFESWLGNAQGGRAGERKGRIRGLFDLLRSFRGNLLFFLEHSYNGAPAGASAEIGERILDLLGAKTADATAEILDGKLSPLDCHSPLWPWRFFLLNPFMIFLVNRLLGFRTPIE
ncbi:MAG TPA: creatininase family protein [Myxococcota bacterium]|nr:creatininase family protein [Myxococcota bacterium]